MIYSRKNYVNIAVARIHMLLNTTLRCVYLKSPSRKPPLIITERAYRVNIKQALAIYKPGADQENNLKRGRGLRRQRRLKGKLWDNFMFTHIINVHTHRVKLYMYTCNCLSLLSIFIFILLLLCFIKYFPIFLNSSGQKQNILVFKVESTAKIFMNTLGTCITVERKFKVARGGRGG